MYDMLTGSVSMRRDGRSAGRPLTLGRRSPQPPFVSSNRKKTIERILHGKLNFPPYMTESARDILRRLLRRTPSARLGSGPGDAEEIKRHLFFAPIPWEGLLALNVPPPIIPHIADPEDVSNFDSRFTTLPPIDSPVESRLSESANRIFAGFSYIAPAVFSELQDGMGDPTADYSSYRHRHAAQWCNGNAQPNAAANGGASSAAGLT